MTLPLDSLKTREQVAKAIVTDGKGILAADESHGTIEKRFKAIELPSNEENRRSYRELLFTTEGAERYIGGVILFDETIRQKTAEGTSFVELLQSKGILPGIKVDKGAKPLALCEGETVTEGLDGLRDRLQEYRSLGARFAKWRAVIAIGDGLPTDCAIDVNAHALARYAALCIEQDLVPIVEPEVLMDGPHDIDRCADATERTLKRVFECLDRQRVPIPQILLKPNMVLSGSECRDKASVEEVAETTVKTFERVLPDDLPGVVFLSGGQGESEATAHLNAMNARSEKPPWPLSFSYGRALQASALNAWKGKASNRAKAQDAFLTRAQLNAAAALGRYASETDPQVAVG